MKLKDLLVLLQLFLGASVVSVVWQFVVGWSWSDFAARSAAVLIVSFVSLPLFKRMTS